MLGEAVGTGLENFARPELEEARQRYARWLDREFRRIYLEDPFDLVVLPGDQFFYVRALPDIVRSMGLPIVVVQKETTISPETMKNRVPTHKRYAPFISDWMTVCSERQKEFWVRAGADPSLFTITGQPRFDVYWNCTPSPAARPPTVLFFSYAVDAYAADDELGQGMWTDLRGRTEDVLVDLARQGEIRVVVKHHPQQDRRGEHDRLRALAGPAWERSFFVADPETDTRQLVLDANVVVGFQSTALYEAAAARRPVVYAAWGDVWERRAKQQLIPFHAAPPGCLSHAQGPDELRSLLCSDLAPPGPKARPWYEEALGPVDGGATDRVVDVLTHIAGKHFQENAAPRDLLRRRRRYAAGLFARSSALELFWLGAHVPAAVLGRSTGVRVRRRQARDFRRLAARGLVEGPRPPHAKRNGRESELTSIGS